MCACIVRQNIKWLTARAELNCACLGAIVALRDVLALKFDGCIVNEIDAFSSLVVGSRSASLSAVVCCYVIERPKSARKMATVMYM